MTAETTDADLDTSALPAVLLINPPYQTITSNLGIGHQVPLGLLCVGGTLADGGCPVRLLDAEARHLSIREIVERVAASGVWLIMTGHAGSTPAHPVCASMLSAIKAALPEVTTVYGGVWPTYHAEKVLRECSGVDIVVRGEGEAAALDVVGAFACRPDAGRAPIEALRHVPGIGFRAGRKLVITPPRVPIEQLDDYRVGWELVEDWSRYQCFGLGRAAVVQFSRGCPHRCTYCGQHQFWASWRHRTPQHVAGEIEHLHRRYGVRFVTLADENPTTDKKLWRRLLEELIGRQLDVHLFATIRATDLVRDEDIMHLYRRAGILYVLMGIESTDESVLRQVRKKSTVRVDQRACALLRDHGIFSIIGHIAGLGDERWSDFRRARRILAAYDGDFLNAMYVTPHRWTAFADLQADRSVVQTDQRRWDYRHQVLGQTRMKPWQLFLAVKWLELMFHLRPRRLWRLLRQSVRRDPLPRRQIIWTTIHITRVWMAEILEFVLHTRHARRPQSLRSVMGSTQEGAVELTVARRPPRDNRTPQQVDAPAPAHMS